MNGIEKFILFTCFRNATSGNLIMTGVMLLFIFLGIRVNYGSLLLVSIGTDIITGNIPFFHNGNINLREDVYQRGNVLFYI